jgi:hypothetical protein
MLSGWTYRIPLRIDSGQFDSTLTDFTVMIKLNSSNAADLFSELGSDANRFKIAIANQSDTEHYVEIARFDYTNSEAELHVLVPSISGSVDTILFLYFDSAHADNTTYVGDTGDSTSVNAWQSDFELVYHMGKVPGATSQADDMLNSCAVSGVNAGEPGVWNLTGPCTLEDSSQMGIKGLAFDGTDDSLKGVGGTATLDKTAFTVEVWFRPDEYPQTNSSAQLFCYYSATSVAIQLMLVDDYLYGMGYINDTAETATFSVKVGSNVDYHGAMTWSSGNEIDLFLNGVKQTPGETVTGGVDRSTNAFYIGNYDNVANREFSGRIDEVRCSWVDRSDAWIEASYQNGKNNIVTVYPTEIDSGEGEGGQDTIFIQWKCTTSGHWLNTTSALWRYHSLCDPLPADGIVFGETAGYRDDIIQTLTDGVIFGDSTLSAYTELVSDGVFFGESTDLIKTLLVSLSDGVTFDDDGGDLSDDMDHADHTITDKWTLPLENYNPSYYWSSTDNPWYPAELLRYQVPNTASRGYGINAYPKGPRGGYWTKSGLYRISFWWSGYGRGEWGAYDTIGTGGDDGNNKEFKFEFMKTNPDSRVSNDFYEMEEGVAGEGNKVSINFRTNYSGKLNVRQYYNGNTPTMLLDADFTYDDTNGDDFIIWFDVDNAWIEVWGNGSLIGERVSIDTNIISAWTDPMLINTHAHFYASSNIAYMDNLLIQRFPSSPKAIGIFPKEVSDGIVFGDTHNVYIVGFCSDGVDFGDTSVQTLAYHVQLAEGVVFSDAVKDYIVEYLSDGVIFDSSVIWLRSYNKDEIDVQPRGQGFDFKALSVITNFEALKKTFDSDTFEGTIPIPVSVKEVQTDFKILPVTTDFKASPKTFDTEV